MGWGLPSWVEIEMNLLDAIPQWESPGVIVVKERVHQARGRERERRREKRKASKRELEDHMPADFPPYGQSEMTDEVFMTTMPSHPDGTAIAILRHHNPKTRMEDPKPTTVGCTSQTHTARNPTLPTRWGFFQIEYRSPFELSRQRNQPHLEHLTCPPK